MSNPSLWQQTGFSKSHINYYFDKYFDLLKWVDHLATVLEVGCADGSLTKQVLLPRITNRIEKLVAIDKEQEMIEFAAKHNSMGKIDYQTLDVMDSKTVDSMKNKFDHIFSFFVAQWIPDNRTFLSCLRVMLKPKGQIFITIMVDTPMQQSFYKHDAEGTWSKFLPKDTIFADYTHDPAGYFRNLVTDSGFEVEVCESKIRKYTMERFQDFLKVVLSFYKYLGRIPQDLQEDYFQDHLKNCADLGAYSSETDSFEMPYEIMVCVARKST